MDLFLHFLALILGSFLVYIGIVQEGSKGYGFLAVIGFFMILAVPFFGHYAGVWFVAGFILSLIAMLFNWVGIEGAKIILVVTIYVCMLQGFFDKPFDMMTDPLERIEDFGFDPNDEHWSKNPQLASYKWLQEHKDDPYYLKNIKSWMERYDVSWEELEDITILNVLVWEAKTYAEKNGNYWFGDVQEGHITDYFPDKYAEYKSKYHTYERWID